MRTTVLLLALVLAFPLLGQQPAEPLKPVTPADKPADTPADKPADKPAAVDVPKATVEEWIQDLGSDDFSRRTAATEKLRGLGDKARPELEKAKAGKNLEQRTRASALLDELDHGTESAPNDDDAVAGENRQRRRRPRLPGTNRIDILPWPPSGPLDPRDLEEFLRKAMESGGIPGGFLGDPRFGLPPEAFGGAMTRTVKNDNECVVLTRDASGWIRVKIEKIDPKTRQHGSPESYEAKGLEEFKERYPEVYEQHKASGLFEEVGTGFRFQSPIVLGHGGQAPGTLVPGRPLAPVESGNAVRLGVVLAAVPEVLRAHVEIPKKAVIIQSVEAGSVAERMGIRAFDVLTTVNGTAVETAEEVRQILGSLTDRPEVQVRILRRGEVLELKGQLPKPR